MNYELLENNQVVLSGEVVSEITYSHEVFNEAFYTFVLSVERLSKEADLIPVTISEKLLAVRPLKPNDKISLKGQFRSYNKQMDGHSKLVLTVFVRELLEYDETLNPNLVTLQGYICKEPIYRTTPFKREICDILLAVNRAYNKSDYLETIRYVNKHGGHVSVITTNWDILLEEYFRKNGIDFDYKFNSPYVIKSDGELYLATGNNADSKVPYIKIHGSINWFRCLKCGTLQICDADTCGKYLFDDSEEEKCVQCGQTGEGDAVQMKPEIITPTMMKLLNSQLYNNLWQNAAYELQQADKVIFCGYSLPLADYEFRYLLKQNIQPGTEIDVVLYYDDDPARCGDRHMISFLPEKRYIDLFPNCKCRFYYDGFGEYFAGENKIWV